MDEEIFWYYNTSDPLAVPKPMFDTETWIQMKAERTLDYLIIFTATVEQVDMW